MDRAPSGGRAWSRSVARTEKTAYANRALCGYEGPPARRSAAEPRAPRGAGLPIFAEHAAPGSTPLCSSATPRRRSKSAESSLAPYRIFVGEIARLESFGTAAPGLLRGD